MANPKIEFAWDSVVDEVLDEGTGSVTGLRLKNVKTGEPVGFASARDVPWHRSYSKHRVSGKAGRA